MTPSESAAWLRRAVDEALPMLEGADQARTAVLGHLPSEQAAAYEAASPDGSRQLSVAFLMSGYVSHLEHHLLQIRSLIRQ